MADKFSLPNWSARNPLGIIALFISLIYGMSALLLGTSVKNLTEGNQTLLVIFIAAFPFVVLSVFGWLVAKHHRKLYGPGDYRSDEGFLNAASAAPPSSLGQRLREEVEQAIKEVPPAPTETKTRSVSQADETATKITFDKKAEAREEKEVTPVLRAYAAENLVFQELQNEFGGALKRHVSLRTPNRRYQLDGLLESGSKTIFVEVKQLLARSSISVVIRRSKAEFGQLIEVYRDNPHVSFLLAIVTNFAITDTNRAAFEAEVRSSLGEKFEIRLYSFADLANKYGLI
jgi:hypothetical protein